MDLFFGLFGVFGASWRLCVNSFNVTLLGTPMTWLASWNQTLWSTNMLLLHRHFPFPILISGEIVAWAPIEQGIAYCIRTGQKCAGLMTVEFPLWLHDAPERLIDHCNRWLMAEFVRPNKSSVKYIPTVIELVWWANNWIKFLEAKCVFPILLSSSSYKYFPKPTEPMPKQNSHFPNSRADEMTGWIWLKKLSLLRFDQITSSCSSSVSLGYHILRGRASALLRSFPGLGVVVVLGVSATPVRLGVSGTGVVCGFSVIGCPFLVSRHADRCPLRVVFVVRGWFDWRKLLSKCVNTLFWTTRSRNACGQTPAKAVQPNRQTPVPAGRTRPPVR